MRPLVVLVRCQALAALASFLVANPQAQQVPRLDLRMKEEKPLSGNPVAEAIFGQTKCDSRGNLYFRTGLRGGLAAPIFKVSPEGEVKAAFSVKGVKGFERATATIYDFAVGLRGQVHLIVRKCEDGKSRKCQVDILTFSEDAAYQSATRLELERDFDPSRLAVFPTGEFLVAGLRDKEAETPEASVAQAAKHSPPVQEPYTAIFDSSGRVRAEVTLPLDSKRLTEGGSEKESDSLGLAVQLGMVAIGEDGNIYLSHHTARPVVYVISSSGVLLRQLQIMSPTESAWPMTMTYAAGGRLVFGFAEKLEEGLYNTGSAIYSLVDAETGERLIDYQSAPGIGGVFVCYTPSGFTFLASTKDGHMAIRQAVPR